MSHKHKNTFGSQFISNNYNNISSLVQWSYRIGGNAPIKCLPVASMNVNKYWSIYKEWYNLIDNI